MGWNRYKWYSNGRKKKRLKKSAPLLLRIHNGDFDVSHYLQEVPRAEREYADKYDAYIADHPQLDYHEGHHMAHQHARKRNEARLKLLEEGMYDEIRILSNLRNSLENEFNIDVWDEATSLNNELNTIEDIYYFYKDKSGMKQTPSEIAIQLGRNTTVGLK